MMSNTIYLFFLKKIARCTKHNSQVQKIYCVHAKSEKDRTSKVNLPHPFSTKYKSTSVSS